jgi:hypothetical protein
MSQIEATTTECHVDISCVQHAVNNSQVSEFFDRFEKWKEGDPVLHPHPYIGTICSLIYNSNKRVKAPSSRRYEKLRIHSTSNWISCVRTAQNHRTL